MSFEPPTQRPPCVVHEDEHLLVVHKPAGWNTHAPAPYAGEGLYDWLKHREPRWATLAIIHRLDKETSGVLVFGKTPLANRSLTTQFNSRTVQKKYRLLAHQRPKREEFIARSRISRTGDNYSSGRQGEEAETHFKVLPAGADHPAAVLIEAEPRSGRTHQIRVHAADQGFPVLGDRLYGGGDWPRVCLHAAEISFAHPESGERVTFGAPADFSADPHAALRAALVAPELTNAYRVIHGASDRWPGWYVDRLGDFLLSHSEGELTAEQLAWLKQAGSGQRADIRGVYHKRLSRHIRGATRQESSPRLVLGEAAPNRIVAREDGVNYELSFAEGYSVGLFLDQRDNRRRWQTGHIAAGFSMSAAGAPLGVLNTFAYTCGFSVCAALAGAHTTSLDLSRKYLDWGRHNFALNGLDPAEHDFIFGDTFDWLKRFQKRHRQFDGVILDPPTFSQSKAGGVFRADRDYSRLVTAALGVLRPGGILFCSTNAADRSAADFIADIHRAARAVRRELQQQHYAPQPPDFPISRAEPAHLKSLWVRVA